MIDNIFSLEEKKEVLKEILKRNQKLLYIYENKNYDYKEYAVRLVNYTTSANIVFKGKLVNIKINLLSVYNNDYSHDEVKRIVFENKNMLEGYLNALN